MIITICMECMHKMTILQSLKNTETTDVRF